MSVSLFNIPYWTNITNPDVKTIIDLQMDFANTAMASMDGYVQDMVDYATSAIDVPIPDPIAGGLDFDFSLDAWNDLIGRRPVSPVTTSVSVTLPIAPTLSLPSIDAALVSALWNTIYEKLNSDLENGGYGIETADELAIWERAKEREMLELLAQYDEADEVFAGAGYKFPPGALLKSKRKAKQSYQNKLAEINRDMTIERLKLFVQCRQFAIEKGSGFGSMFLELQKLLTEIYDSEIKGALGTAEIAMKNNEILIDKYKSDIDAYIAEAKVISELYELASTEQEREVRVQVAVLQANIEVARAYLLQSLEQAKLRYGGAQAAAEVYKAICASALGTIHASASMSSSFGASYGYSKGESVSQSYTENV